MLGLTRLGAEAFIGAVLVQAVSSMMGTAVPCIAPEVTRALHSGNAFSGLYVGFLFAGACISSLTGGNFIRKYGPAHICEIALIFATLSVLLGMTALEAVVIVSAFCLGLAKGPLMPAINAMLSRQIDKKSYNVIFSLKQCSGPIGMAAAGAILPFLATHFGWRFALAFVALCCLAVAIWCSFIKKHQDTTVFKDEPITLAHSIDSFKLVMQTRGLRQLSLLGAIYDGIQMSLLAYIVVFLVQMKFSLIFGGIAVAVANFGGIAGRIFWGEVADKIKSAKIVLSLCGLFMAALTVVLSFADPGWSKGLVLALSFVLGFTSLGWSGVFFAQVAAQAPGGRVAEATGGVDFFSFLGAIFIPMGFGLLGDHLDNFVYSFWIVSALTALGAIYLLFTKDIKPAC